MDRHWKKKQVSLLSPVANMMLRRSSDRKFGTATLIGPEVLRARLPPCLRADSSSSSLLPHFRFTPSFLSFPLPSSIVLSPLSSLSLAVLLLVCLCLRSLSTSVSYQPQCLLPWPSFLIFLTDPLITLIGFSGVVGILVISALLAPAARLASKFTSSTVNYKYMTALHISVYIYAYPRYLDRLSVTSLFLNNSTLFYTFLSKSILWLL